MTTTTTTIEQGKRLLDAGYLPETADALWVRHRIFNSGPICILAPSSSWNILSEDLYDNVPAWSLAALWDLCEDLPLSFSTMEDRADAVIDTLVDKLIETSPYNLL